MCVCSVMSDCFETPWTVTHQAQKILWNFSGKNTGVGCHFFLQGIFLSQGLAGGFFTTEPPGKPQRILELK